MVGTGVMVRVSVRLGLLLGLVSVTVHYALFFFAFLQFCFFAFYTCLQNFDIGLKVNVVARGHYQRSKSIKWLIRGLKQNQNSRELSSVSIITVLCRYKIQYPQSKLHHHHHHHHHHHQHIFVYCVIVIRNSSHR